MQTTRLIQINLLCCCIFNLTVVNCSEERQFNSKYFKQSGTNVLRNKLLENMGLNPAEMEGAEKYSQLAEKWPHLVPDFMKSLFHKYRFELFNLTLEIEGKRKHLGPIEIVKSHRLKEIHTWPKAGIHKLIFKYNSESSSTKPFAKELRLNKRLFPKKFTKHQKTNTPVLTILTIFDNWFQIVKRMTIHSSSFSKDGWTSVDISDTDNDSVFFLKFFSVSQTNKTSLEFAPSHMNERYPYYANIIGFFRYKSPTFHFDRRLNENVEFHPNRKSRNKRDLLHYSMGTYNEDCQRHALLVTFKEVGWSKWIIAPQYYNAYYCKGNCPYPLSDNFNATNHAIIQLLVHGLKDVSVPKPCCVPFMLSPETLLYLSNESDAVLREFKDMSVNSCSCR